jgi:tripartite-type tricarboxylate transporter receptor subunit TctC
MNMAKASYRGRDSITLLGGSNIMFELRTCDWLRLSALGCVLLAVTHTAAAQSFPSRPLTLVVPFAAGGPSDVAGRIVAQGLSEKLGQQVVVENPAGAGGTLGSLRVAKAPPDGYQFVIGNSGTHAWSQALYKKPPYNTITDFAALGLVVEAPRAIITPKNFPANTLPEFIAYVKANQNTVKYGSAGAGSASHVSCILLNAALGVDIVHIPYRGLGPAMQDLIAGRIDYMCDSPSTSRPQIETNNVKAIATTGGKRTSVLPDVPTAREQGLDFEIMAWQGLFLPKDTPDPIVRHVNQALSAALDLPFVRERFKAVGEDVAPVERRSPEYFAKFVAAEIDKWSEPIKASGVSVD